LESLDTITSQRRRPSLQVGWPEPPQNIGVDLEQDDRLLFGQSHLGVSERPIQRLDDLIRRHEANDHPNGNRGYAFDDRPA
jgi:hypothetical protein